MTRAVRVLVAVTVLTVGALTVLARSADAHTQPVPYGHSVSCPAASGSPALCAMEYMVGDGAAYGAFYRKTNGKVGTWIGTDGDFNESECPNGPMCIRFKRVGDTSQCRQAWNGGATQGYTGFADPNGAGTLGEIWYYWYGGCDDDPGSPTGEGIDPATQADPPNHDFAGEDNIGGVAQDVGSCETVRPSVLMGVAFVESTYNLNRDADTENGATALGPYQFITTTWGDWGRDRGAWEGALTPTDGADRLQVGDAMEAAHDYLLYLKNRNSGDIRLALLDYNGASEPNGYDENVLIEADRVRAEWDPEGCADDGFGTAGEGGETDSGDLSDCAPSGWSILNPLAYVAATGCVLQWAFVPDLAVVEDAFDGVTDELGSSILGGAAGLVTNLVLWVDMVRDQVELSLNDEGLCQGPTAEVELPAGEIEVAPMGACEGSFGSQMAGIIMPWEVGALILGAVLLCLRLLSSLVGGDNSMRDVIGGGGGEYFEHRGETVWRGDT